MTNGAQWRSCLMNERWFASLPALLQDSLLSGMKQRRVTPGKTVCESGESFCGLFALMEGSVRFGDVDEQVHPQSLPASRRPYWFNEISLFEDLPLQHDIYAENQIILLHMPAQALMPLMHEHPFLWRYFGDLLGTKLGVSVPRPELITELPTVERVAFRLLMLSEGHGALNRTSRVIPIGQVPSDRYLSLATESLEWVLEKFVQSKIISRDHGDIQVLNREMLVRAARHRLTVTA